MRRERRQLVLAFGNLLRDYRLAAGLTQEALAEQAGLSVRGIQALERGDHAPQRDTLARLTRSLALSSQQATLFAATGQPRPRRAGRAARSGGQSLPHQGGPWLDLPVWHAGAEPAHVALPFVGRAAELERLRESAELARRGKGRLALIAGEPGIGKTALVHALARDAAEHGAVVLLGGCTDLPDAAPYAPWIELLRSYPATPELPALSSAVAWCGTRGGILSRAGLADQLQEFLAQVAAKRPLVLLLEDLHWADAASLELLRDLSRGWHRLPILVVGTYRPDDAQGRAPLRQHLPALVRESVPLRLMLRPLDDAAVRVLVSARYPLPANDAERLMAYLRERAAGNPFFIGELLRALDEEGLVQFVGGAWRLADLTHVRIPTLLQQVIEARVHRLGDDAWRLLMLAAVIGDEVPLGLWASTAACDKEQLIGLVENAVDAHLLEALPDGSMIRFAHSLVRHALYDRWLPPRRRLAHRDVAQALVADPAADSDTVAHHFREAGDPRAADWLKRAGDRACLAYAWVMAAERYAAALELRKASGASDVELGWLEFQVGSTLRFVDVRRAAAAMQRALRLAQAAGDALLAVLARGSLGVTCCIMGDLERGIAEQQAALAGLEQLSAADHQRRATLGGTAAPYGQHIPGTLALWLSHAGRYAEARSTVERLLESSLSADDARLASGYLGLGCAEAALGRPEAARAAFHAARARYRSLEHWALLGWTSASEVRWSALRYRADAVAERRTLADEAEDAWRRASPAQADLAPGLAQLPLLWLEGRWRDAEDLATAALAVANAGGPTARWRLFLCARLAWLARERGNARQARELIQVALPGGVRSQPGNTAHIDALAVQRLAAQLACDAGDLTTARAWLEAHDRWLAWSGATLDLAEGQLAWAEYHRAAGDMGQARSAAHVALQQASRPRQPLAQLAARRLLGRLEAESGRSDQAIHHLQAALSLADACAAPHERALTLLALARCRGAPESARLLDDARRLCESLGAAVTLAEVDALTAGPPGSEPVAPVRAGIRQVVGARPRRRGRALPPSITPPP